MPGGAKYLRRGPAFDDFAGVQNGDAMAQRGDREQIVGNIEDTHAEFAVELSEQAQDFGLRDGVQSAGGFIGDEQGRAVEDSHSDDNALGLGGAGVPGEGAEKVGGVRGAYGWGGVTGGYGAFWLGAGGGGGAWFAGFGGGGEGWVGGGQ